MLPSMPILFSLSNDNMVEGVHNQESDSPKKDLNPELPKKVPSISDEIPNYRFESIPEDERECDDELVLLAENTPFNEKRKLLTQANSTRKKRKLETIQPVDRNSDEEQINHFATAYFMKAKGELDEETFQKFITLLSELNEENVDVPSFYYDITSLLSGYPDLVYEFLGFLKPHQALEVGRLDEYLSLKQSWDFLRKLDPFYFNKLNHLLEQLSTNSDVTIDLLKSSLHSLFKGHPNITEGILGLLPDEKPPPSCKEDYEDISDLSLDNSNWETLNIPESKGRCLPGECECICHSLVPKKFCTFCNIKFSKGQIYVQTGKGLRFAKMTFKGQNQLEMLQKLHPTYYIKLTTRKRTKSESRSRSRAGADHTSKSDSSAHGNVNGSDKSTANLEKDSNENDHHQLDEDEKILESGFNSDTDKFIVYEDINNDDFVSEDVVLESTNSEEAEDMEYDSTEEFNMEMSPNSLKNDEDSFNSMEHIFEDKDSRNVIIPEDQEVIFLPVNENENFHEKSESGLPMKEDLDPSIVINVGQPEMNETSLQIKDKPDPTIVIEVGQPEMNETSLQIKDEPDPTIVIDVGQPGMNETSLQIKDESDPTIVIDVGQPGMNETSLQIKDESDPTIVTEVGQPEMNETILQIKDESDPTIVIEVEQSEMNETSLQIKDESVPPIVIEVGPPEMNETSLQIKDEPDPPIVIEVEQSDNTETKEESKLWTREEDKLILQAFQRQLGMEQTFSEISKQLPSRTVDDIQGRFQVLMNLLEKMTSGSYEGYPSSLEG